MSLGSYLVQFLGAQESKDDLLGWTGVEGKWAPASLYRRGSGAGMGAYSQAPAPTPPPPDTDAELRPPLAVQGGEVERCRGRAKSLSRTCNPSPTAACTWGSRAPVSSPASVSPPQVHRVGTGGGAQLDPGRPLTPQGLTGPRRTAGRGSGPASPTGCPREGCLRGPTPAWPGGRAHSLRCRPPPPQLGLARLGLRISARPADLSASMTAPAAAAKTPSGKTFRGVLATS